MSTGPSLTAHDRSPSTRTADTGDAVETADRTPEAETTSFALRYAKWTFDPFNTRPCPEMFGDKWSTTE